MLTQYTLLYVRRYTVHDGVMVGRGSISDGDGWQGTQFMAKARHNTVAKQQSIERIAWDPHVFFK